MSRKTKISATKEDGKPALVPKLRFPEFRGAEIWTRHPLRELTTHVLDGDWIESKDQADSGFRLIQTGNIGVGVFIAKSGKSRYISEDTFNRLKCTEVFPGDCLISRLPDPAGRSCFLPDIGQRMITAVDCAILRFKVNEIVPEIFLAYSQTDGYFREIAALSSGSTRQRVSRENLSNIVLVLPKLPEQQKIAECLSSVDELMAAQGRKVDALKTHKKGLMQQLFPREGETQPRLRFPEFQNAGEWVEKRLSSEITLISGMHLSPDQYSTAGEVPYFTGPSDFTNDIKSVTKWTKRSANMAAPNDTLITVKGSGVGEVWYSTLPAVAIGRQLMAVRVKQGSSQFIFQFLLTKKTRFEDLGAGNLIPGLSRTDILEMEAHFPSPAEQQRIASCLSSLDALITLETQKLEALKTHKKGLMQQLFPSVDEVEA